MEYSSIVLSRLIVIHGYIRMELTYSTCLLSHTSAPWRVNLSPSIQVVDLLERIVTRCCSYSTVSAQTQRCLSIDTFQGKNNLFTMAGNPCTRPTNILPDNIPLELRLEIYKHNLTCPDLIELFSPEEQAERQEPVPNWEVEAGKWFDFDPSLLVPDNPDYIECLKLFYAENDLEFYYSPTLRHSILASFFVAYSDRLAYMRHIIVDFSSHFPVKAPSSIHDLFGPLRESWAGLLKRQITFLWDGRGVAYQYRVKDLLVGLEPLYSQITEFDPQPRINFVYQEPSHPNWEYTEEMQKRKDIIVGALKDRRWNFRVERGLVR